VSLTIRFLHGWAFDAKIWNGVIERLTQFDCQCPDRGYFGSECTEDLREADFIVGHSFGVMLALGDLPSRCKGMVAINGFDCFTAREGFPGVQARVVDRMAVRLEQDPARVVSDFRLACGSMEPYLRPDVDRLERDLAALRDKDMRMVTAGMTIPLLSLQGAHDRILPPAMRDAVFAGSDRVERRTHPHAGHLLPIDDPAYCARAIENFVRQAG